MILAKWARLFVRIGTMNEAEERFQRDHPEIFFPQGSSKREVERYLRQHKIEGRVKAVTVAGAGNMNCTLRIHLDGEVPSCVLKQAYPYVAKYPHIAAPHDRLLLEGAFYKHIAPHAALADKMPQVLAEDPVSRIMILEDLGERGDLSFAYQEQANIESSHLEDLATYLAKLHNLDPSPLRGVSLFENRAMRQLNYQHIFEIPFAPNNGLNLDAFTPGLEDLAKTFQKDTPFLERVRHLGQALYLDDGPHLLHGDFFLGSCLLDRAGHPRIIDTEFAFLGHGEFDLGVFLAHLHLACQSPHRIGAALKSYAEHRAFEEQLVYAQAGVEIARRLLGVAQLPTSAKLSWKSDLLAQARGWVLALPL